MDIIQKLHHRQSMKDITQNIGTSVSAAARCLSLLNVRKPDKLPRMLSIDKFKGDVSGKRFQCSLTPSETRRILDILPNRTASTLQSYLITFPNRHKVELEYPANFLALTDFYLPNSPNYF